MNTTKRPRPGKHVPHWKAYNRVLRQRGSLTIYLGRDIERSGASQSLLASVVARPCTRMR